MSKHAVHKYPVEAEREFVVTMPVGAQILSVHAAGDDASMWALVDPRATVAKVERTFRVLSTGETVRDAHELTFIGTFFVKRGLVFHLFEKLPRPE